MSTFRQVVGSSSDCIVLNKDMSFTICAEYQGINHDLTLTYSPVSSDPQGMYWKLDDPKGLYWNVTLADVIIALKVLVGLNPAGVRADVNGDGKIGLEEVVYSLQIVAGLR